MGLQKSNLGKNLSPGRSWPPKSIPHDPKVWKPRFWREIRRANGPRRVKPPATGPKVPVSSGFSNIFNLLGKGQGRNKVGSMRSTPILSLSKKGSKFIFIWAPFMEWKYLLKSIQNQSKTIQKPTPEKKEKWRFSAFTVTLQTSKS